MSTDSLQRYIEETRIVLNDLPNNGQIQYPENVRSRISTLDSMLKAADLSEAEKAERQRGIESLRSTAEEKGIL